MTLLRFHDLVSELQAADPSGQVLALLVAEIGDLQATRRELQRLTAADPRLRAAILSFLEGLRGLRDTERYADEDSRRLAQAELIQ